MPARIFRSFSLALLAAVSLFGQLGKPSGTPEVLDPAKFVTRTVWIPYWSEKDGHHAILHLRNALHHYPLAATVEVFSQHGVVLATRSMSLPRLANLDLPLQSVIPSGGPDSVRSGSIRVSYSYPHEGVLQAELSIRDDTRNHAYTIVGRRPYAGTSNNAYLAIHRPTKDTYLEMAFTNSAPEKDVTVRLSVRQSGAWRALNAFTLRPLNTEKLRIASETLNAAFQATAPEAVLLRAEYSVTSAEVIANAWLEDEKSGFSNTALFHDEYPKSNSLYATQLVLGAFPETALAASPRFDGSLVFVNVAEEPSTLAATLYCLADDVTTPIALPPRMLEPFTPYQVDLSSIATGKVNSSRGAICSAEFSHTGAPGHVIGRYYAASVSKTYGVYVKLEPFAGRAYSEVYWTVEGDFSPLLTVANFSAEKDTIEVYVSEGESITMLDSQEVEPYGSFTVNLRDLIKPLKAEVKFKGDFGGLYIKTVKPTGKLLVKQHAISAKRLLMAPYYGGYDYIFYHGFVSAPTSLDVKQQSTASVVTGYSSSGWHYDEWFIYSSNTNVLNVQNIYGLPAPRTVSGVAVGNAHLDSAASGPVDPYGTYGMIYASPSPQVQVNPQVPYRLSKVGTDTTSSEAQCTTSGGLPGCGVTRTFRYQVLDVRGNTIQRGGMPISDAINTGNPNGCNLGGYTVTPPGQATDAQGQFSETLNICAPACRSGSSCTVGCTTAANQTWTVDNVALSNDVKALSYQCDRVLVNGQ